MEALTLILLASPLRANAFLNLFAPLRRNTPAFLGYLLLRVPLQQVRGNVNSLARLDIMPLRLDRASAAPALFFAPSLNVAAAIDPSPRIARVIGQLPKVLLPLGVLALRFGYLAVILADVRSLLELPPVLCAGHEPSIGSFPWGDAGDNHAIKRPHGPESLLGGFLGGEVALEYLAIRIVTNGPKIVARLLPDHSTVPLVTVVHVQAVADVNFTL